MVGLHLFSLCIYTKPKPNPPTETTAICSYSQSFIQSFHPTFGLPSLRVISPPSLFQKKETNPNKSEEKMEAMKMNAVVLAAALMMLMALSAVQNVAAVGAPAEAPAPAADAAAFVPAVFASLAALVLGMLF